MKNPERIDLMLEELSLLWKMQPDLRLGQLIGIVRFKSGSKADTFYIEDDLLFKGIKSFKSNLESVVIWNQLNKNLCETGKMVCGNPY